MCVGTLYITRRDSNMNTYVLIECNLLVITKNVFCTKDMIQYITVTCEQYSKRLQAQIRLCNEDAKYTKYIIVRTKSSFIEEQIEQIELTSTQSQVILEPSDEKVVIIKQDQFIKKEFKKEFVDPLPQDFEKYRTDCENELLDRYQYLKKEVSTQQERIKPQNLQYDQHMKDLLLNINDCLRKEFDMQHDRIQKEYDLAQAERDLYLKKVLEIHQQFKVCRRINEKQMLLNINNNLPEEFNMQCDNVQKEHDLVHTERKIYFKKVTEIHRQFEECRVNARQILSNIHIHLKNKINIYNQCESEIKQEKSTIQDSVTEKQRILSDTIEKTKETNQYLEQLKQFLDTIEKIQRKIEQNKMLI